jgi:UDP-N-acetylmuramyl pentapeptide phosphotransferase/UDP-N-acetylglucosamine-1-phosphate transferase
MSALLIRLVINLAAPALAYVLLRPHVHSDITALVAGAAVPIAYTAGVLLWRRRLDVIGVFAIVCFVIGLTAVAATGGNELAFKLREEIWTGPLGLACLISVAAGRPLLVVVVRRTARRNPQIAERISNPYAHRIPTVSTGAIGAILLVHALVMVALALATSTTIFLALKLPVSLAIVGSGLVALVCWIRHHPPGQQGRPPAGADGTNTHPHAQEERDNHAHRDNPPNGHHQRTDRLGVARRPG